jgi:hypothetical protein
MFNYELEKDEIILSYDNEVSLLKDDNLIKGMLLLTDKHIIFFIDSNKDLGHKEILRITKGVSELPTYELFMKESILNIKEVNNNELFDEYHLHNGDIIVFTKNEITDELRRKYESNRI